MFNTYNPDVAIIDGDHLIYKTAFSVANSYTPTLEHAKDRLFENLQKLLMISGTWNWIGFVEGKGNFRKKVAEKFSINTQYKANRKDTEKPAFFYELKEFMHKELGFYKAVNCESDDLCGIFMTRIKNSVCVSPDKDLLQVPGLHLQISADGSGAWYEVDKQGTFKLFANNKKFFATGDILLHAQTLIGDSTDNFVGLPGAGKVTVANNFTWLDGTDLADFVRRCFVYKYGKKEGTVEWIVQRTMAFILREAPHIPDISPRNFLDDFITTS